MTERKARPALSVLGIQISRRTDILAATAFLISITGLLYQIYGAVQGPKVLQFPPEQILFFPEESNGRLYVHGGARLSYVNKGREGKNAVVKAQRMIIELSGKTYEWQWQFFDQFGSHGDQLTHSEAPEPALPTVIRAGEAFSRETHFAARTLKILDPVDSAEAYKNFLPWDDFVSALSKVKEFDVRFVSQFYGSDDQEIKVFFPITQPLLTSIKRLRWAAPSCWPR